MKNIREKKFVIIITIYLLLSLILQITNSTLFLEVINPIICFALLSYLVYYLNAKHLRLPKNKKLFINMILIVTIYAVGYFYLGLIFGYSKSPFKHDIYTLLTNSVEFLLPVIIIELLRAITIYKNRHNKNICLLVTIMLFLIEINYNTILTNLDNREYIFKYFSQTVIPLLGSNLLFSYLTIKGSFYLTVPFRIVQKAILIYLPILPSLDWFMSGSLHLVIYTVIFYLYKYKFLKEKKDVRKQHETKKSKIIYVTITTACITLILFMLGIFRYEPIAILSNSMLPTYERGDVIIYDKPSKEDLKKLDENSIIIYRIGNQYVAHRIVDKIVEDGEVKYQTRGDNNNAPDAKLVSISQIKGVYKFHINGVGYPSIWLNEFFNNEKAKVETK